MNKSFKLRPIPIDFADRFADGSYTVGRGADPSTASGRAGDPVHLLAVEAIKRPKAVAKKRSAKSTAE